MADDGLNGGAASHLSFDLAGHPWFLPGCMDFELVLGRRIVAAVSGIGVEPFDRIADEVPDRRGPASPRATNPGIAGQRLHVGDELAAFAVLESGGNADLDPELVRLVRFALADALHLGRVQAVDLWATLPALLLSHPPGEAQQKGEFGFEAGIAIYLAGNVPDDAAEIGPERAQSPVGALDRFGVGVPLMLEQGNLAPPPIRLP